MMTIGTIAAISVRTPARQEQLEELREQRDREIREGDKRETREYNSKIRNLEKDMRRTGKI